MIRSHFCYPLQHRNVLEHPDRIELSSLDYKTRIITVILEMRFCSPTGSRTQPPTLKEWCLLPVCHRRVVEELGVVEKPVSCLQSRCICHYTITPFFVVLLGLEPRLHPYQRCVLTKLDDKTIYCCGKRRCRSQYPKVPAVFRTVLQAAAIRFPVFCTLYEIRTHT